MPGRRTALVTGANRGIGRRVCLDLARLGHDVWLAARDVETGRRAAAELAKETGRTLRFVELDLEHATSIDAAYEQVPAVDILVNNGAVLPEGSVLEIDAATWHSTVAINLMGAVACIRAWAPGMTERGWGRIVNVTSGWGSFDRGLTGPAAYSITKAALNAVTRNAANDLPRGVKINSVDPGWVRTDMGGPGAARSVEQGARGIVWAATLPDDGPTGGFFRDGMAVGW